jgi:hypothetical protein
MKKARGERLLGRGVQLTVDQWAWVDMLAKRQQHGSSAAVLRAMVAEAMEREAKG